MNDVRLLTFDLDNTLWDVERIIVRAEADMVAWLDAHYPDWQRVGRDGLRALRGDVARQQPEICHDLTAVRLEVLRRALLQAGYDEAGARAGAAGAFEVFFAGRHRVTLFEGVADVLSGLSQVHPLYALSNGNADIGRAGLAGYFSAQLSAASVGFAKPHPRMFEEALSLAGVSAAQALHIGDHPEQDVAAAQAVGMKAVWVNYSGLAWPLTQPPDGEIRHFSELPAMIARLVSTPQV